MKTTVLLICLLLAIPAMAETTLRQGHISSLWELFRDPSPTPYCGAGWNVPVIPEGGSFHETGSWDEEPCLSSWMVHCDADSLSYQGSWTTSDPNHPYWNFCYVDFLVQAELEFSEAVRVYARSRSEGILVEDIHRVVLGPQGAEEQMVLGPEPGGDLAIDLEPGIYTLAIMVDATEHNTHYDYAASLRVWWADLGDVPVQPATWSAVKALYR